MAYDDGLARRIRDALAGLPPKARRCAAKRPVSPVSFGARHGAVTAGACVADTSGRRRPRFPGLAQALAFELPDGCA